MVHFFQRWCILGVLHEQFGGLSDNLIEDVYAQTEIAGVEEGAVFFFCFLADGWKLGIPTRCARDNGNSGIQTPRKIADSGIGMGKFDGHICRT